MSILRVYGGGWALVVAIAAPGCGDAGETPTGSGGASAASSSSTAAGTGSGQGGVTSSTSTSSSVGSGGGEPAGPWLSVKPAGGADDIAQYVGVFETWLGRPTDAITIFTSLEHWTDATGEFVAASYHVGKVSAVDKPVLWAVGLTPDDATDGALAEVAAGDHDAEFVEAADVLAGFRPQDEFVYIRLGWEMNGDWYTWSTTGTPAEYVDAFVRVAGIFREASPRFRFVWCPNARSGSNAHTESYYPGDDYVDVIGLDVYWHDGFGDDPAAAYTNVEVGDSGLAWHAGFAAARGKPIAFDEWGVRPEGGPFVDGMASWIAAHPPLWHSYWDSNAGYPGRISDGMSGSTGEQYIEHFGP